jgi:hypothetical protein
MEVEMGYLRLMQDKTGPRVVIEIDGVEHLVDGITTLAVEQFRACETVMRVSLTCLMPVDGLHRKSKVDAALPEQVPDFEQQMGVPGRARLNVFVPFSTEDVQGQLPKIRARLDAVEAYLAGQKL